MKYVVFCYNMLTLSRAVYYTDHVWGKKNTRIIYSDVFSDIPEKIRKDYSISVVSQPGLDQERGIRAIIDSCRWTRNIYTKLKKICTRDQGSTLVIFRDNEVQEATLIERWKRNKKNRVILMEEGAGLYAMSRNKTRFAALKRVFYRFYGLSVYSLQDRPQGMNEKVDCVICGDPDRFLEKAGRDRKAEVVQMEDVFTSDFSRYIAEAITGKPMGSTTYDYVFLTQPFSMFRDQAEELKRIHDTYLPQVFQILESRGRVLIKLHPREDYDYSRYANDRIHISSQEEGAVPFECLMVNYGQPQMISMFSSVSFNIKVKQPSIYLYKLFQIPIADDLFSEKMLKDHHIILCNSLEDLESVINSGLKEGA